MEMNDVAELIDDDDISGKRDRLPAHSPLKTVEVPEGEPTLADVMNMLVARNRKGSEQE